MAFVSVQQCLMSSLMFLFVWTMEIGSAASLSSLESDLPNSSRFFLGGVTRRRCPSLAVGSSVSINEHGTGLLQAVRHDRHASCHYPVQCDVSASPPEVGCFKIYSNSNFKRNKAQIAGTLAYIMQSKTFNQSNSWTQKHNQITLCKIFHVQPTKLVQFTAWAPKINVKLRGTIQVLTPRFLSSSKLVSNYHNSSANWSLRRTDYVHKLCIHPHPKKTRPFRPKVATPTLRAKKRRPPKGKE